MSASVAAKQQEIWHNKCAYSRFATASFMPKTSAPAPALHFVLTDEYIAAANHGAPFTREALRAVCKVQKSAKLQAWRTPIESQQTAKKYMEEIWKAWMEEYRQNPDAPARHAAAERDIGEKVSGIVLRELISNAHDSNAGDPFGGKGLGLRAILSISHTPRFHSGCLSFRFDRKLAHAALKKGLGEIKLGDTPLMRLPFPASASKEPKHIQELIDDYDTVVIIPFLSAKARAALVKEWDRFVDDVTTLLHLPALDHITWERDDDVEKTKRTWVRDKGKNAVRMIDEGRRAASSRVRLRPPPRRR